MPLINREELISYFVHKGFNRKLTEKNVYNMEEDYVQELYNLLIVKNE